MPVVALAVVGACVSTSTDAVPAQLSAASTHVAVKVKFVQPRGGAAAVKAKSPVTVASAMGGSGRTVALRAKPNQREHPVATPAAAASDSGAPAQLKARSLPPAPQLMSDGGAAMAGDACTKACPWQEGPAPPQRASYSNISHPTGF